MAPLKLLPSPKRTLPGLGCQYMESHHIRFLQYLNSIVVAGCFLFSQEDRTVTERRRGETGALDVG
jgi:hypothetical protein